MSSPSWFSLSKSSGFFSFLGTRLTAVVSLLTIYHCMFFSFKHFATVFFDRDLINTKCNQFANDLRPPDALVAPSPSTWYQDADMSR